MVRRIERKSTTRRIAPCNAIILREGDHVRLAFVPAIVDIPGDPNSCVDGQFVYQRKSASERWMDVPTDSLATIREGDEFKLTLHAKELRSLLEGLVPLYRSHRPQRVPKGSKTFVQVDREVAQLISNGQGNLTSFLKSNPEEATKTLLKLVNWLTTSPDRRETVEKLASMAPEQLPTLTALLGLAAVKRALAYWKEHTNEPSEEFWQESFAEQSFVLSQVFAYPVVMVGTKAYVGGKQVNRTGGKEVDFLLAAESTDAVILVEIKTPQTELLGSEYRGNVFPLSRELSGAVAQVLRYRQLFVRTFDSLGVENPTHLTLGEPRCIVIAGLSSKLSTQTMKENFELQREHVRGVTILTFDELFGRIEHLVSLLEGRP